MFPQRELDRLAAHKAALRLTIRARRADCAIAAARVARPLAWLDRALALWRKLAPYASLAAVPLGLLATRTVFRKRKLLRTLVGWAPLFFSAVKLVSPRTPSYERRVAPRRSAAPPVRQR